MASTITAGNATNGLGISSDNTGILALKSGTGAGTTALTIDASQNTTFAGNVSGVLKSGTAVASTSGTSIDFTGIPSTAKRITVMFSGVSTNGTSQIQIQLGSTTFATSGYSCIVGSQFSNVTGVALSTAGFISAYNVSAATNAYGSIILSNLGSNYWTGQGSCFSRNDSITNTAGGITLSNVLDRVRITTVNGTDTFDAGSINIMWE